MHINLFLNRLHNEHISLIDALIIATLLWYTFNASISVSKDTSIGVPTDESISAPIDELISEPTDEHADESIYDSIDKSFGTLFNASINVPVDETVGGFIDASAVLRVGVSFSAQTNWYANVDANERTN